MIVTIVDKELNKRFGTITVRLLEQAEGFNIYSFLNGNQEEIALGDEIDFLKLFSEIAENIYSPNQEGFGSFLVATNVGGSRLFEIEYSDEDCLKYKWATVFLRQFQQTLRPDQLDGSLSFFAEISLVNASKEGFEKEARKLIRILQDENRDAWQNVIEEKTDFLKTDVYVFKFDKLYSWAFQPVQADGVLNPNRYLVRPKLVRPRGAIRHEHNNHSGRRIRNRLANARSKAGYY